MSTTNVAEKPKKPSWLKVKLPTGESYKKVRNLVSEHNLHTICESGNHSELQNISNGLYKKLSELQLKNI